MTGLFQGVREGWFGDVLEINAMMGKQADAATRRELAALPGGGMFELACHLVDAVVTVMGKPQQVSAFSTQYSDTGLFGVYGVGHKDSITDLIWATQVKRKRKQSGLCLRGAYRNPPAALHPQSRPHRIG